MPDNFTNFLYGALLTFSHGSSSSADLTISSSMISSTPSAPGCCTSTFDSSCWRPGGPTLVNGV